MNLIDILFIPINKIKKTIGKTDDTGGSSSTGTVMGKLNNIISNNSSNVIGNTTDTGGTATAGTVMGKLNNITSRAVLPGIKIVSVGTSGTTTTINGSGLFFWISTGSNLNSCVITIDGIAVSASSIGNGAKYCLSAGAVGSAIVLTQISATAQAIPIPFNSSLIVKAPYNVSTDIVYALNS